MSILVMISLPSNVFNQATWLLAMPLPPLSLWTYNSNLAGTGPRRPIASQGTYGDLKENIVPFSSQASRSS